MFTEMIIHDKKSNEYFWTNGQERKAITETQADEIIGDWEMQGHFANYATYLNGKIEKEWY